MKLYRKDNVYQASQKRLKWLFDNFQYVYVSFSGGKDSSVLLNLAIDFIKNNKLNTRLGVFHIDYEAQYQMTTDFVTETFNNLPDFCDKYWCCLPLSVPCATSMYQHTWIPWEESKKDIWVREMPKDCINLQNHQFDFFIEGMEDYEFQKKIGAWIAKKIGKKTACLIGTRASESYDRHIMLANRLNKRKYPGILWSTGGVSDEQYNFYPIYDWEASDIWVYNAQFKKSYNKLYDLYFQAGLTIEQMRVASPFISQGIESLALYKVIDPNTWGKLISRVNGVSFAGIYGGTTAMGWKSIKKPTHFTWKEYLDFLLNTLPIETANRYREKFATSIKFWKEKGGVLDKQTIKELKNNSVKFKIKKETNYKTEKKPVIFAEYPDELDVTEFSQVPSYKRMCVCIMKNDILCTYMGFTLTKAEQERRRSAIERYKAL